ncbi:BCCT family transporter [Babesia caballi]|uniref:BCCT family transporter n=1 Tax=Babesia caballi TaxID=5871 RepID=A0AAV4M0F6_BABCB|nr:BCCT family transporter [Babesia caballi]
MATERNTTAKHGNRGLDAPQNHKLISNMPDSVSPIARITSLNERGYYLEFVLGRNNGCESVRGYTIDLNSLLSLAWEFFMYDLISVRFIDVDNETGNVVSTHTGWNFAVIRFLIFFLVNATFSCLSKVMRLIFKVVRSQELGTDNMVSADAILSAAYKAAYETAKAIMPPLAESAAMKEEKRIHQTAENLAKFVVKNVVHTMENNTQKSPDCEFEDDSEYDCEKQTECDDDLDSFVLTYRLRSALSDSENYVIYDAANGAMANVAYDIAHTVAKKYAKRISNEAAKKVTQEFLHPYAYVIARDEVYSYAFTSIYEKTSHKSYKYARTHVLMATHVAIQRYRSAVNSAIPQ